MDVASPRFKFAALVTALAGAVVVLFIFEPAQSSIYAPCLFHKLTGLYCPGCGSTRALHQLLHGHFIKAMSFNSLTVLVLPFLIYAFLSYGLTAIKNCQLPRIFVRPIFVWTLVAVIIIFGVLRNVPIYPFRMLAP
jgi:hypothetical protein